MNLETYMRTCEPKRYLYDKLNGFVLSAHKNGAKTLRIISMSMTLGSLVQFDDFLAILSILPAQSPPE